MDELLYDCKLFNLCYKNEIIEPDPLHMDQDIETVNVDSDDDVVLIEPKVEVKQESTGSLNTCTSSRVHFRVNPVDFEKLDQIRPELLKLPSDYTPIPTVSSDVILHKCHKCQLGFQPGKFCLKFAYAEQAYKQMKEKDQRYLCTVCGIEFVMRYKRQSRHAMSLSAGKESGNKAKGVKIYRGYNPKKQRSVKI